MNATKIEWTHKTVNLAWGCEKVSPGCVHCYAERISAVRAKHPNPMIAAMYEGVTDRDGHWTGRVNLLGKFPSLPRKGRRIFVGSMTDLFQTGIPNVFLLRLWQWMRAYPQHTFQILTKRPERMADFLGEYFSSPLPNVWGMTTVCNQSEADEKIPHLLRAPLAVRGVSIEPMLGAVDLRGKLCHWTRPDGSGSWFSPVLGKVHHRLLDWVICGGETGPGARPMHPDWVRGLRDQCQSAGVPFFFKSWGEWLPSSACPDGFDAGAYPWTGVATRPQAPEEVYLVGKRRAGRLLDGVEHNEFPEMQA